MFEPVTVPELTACAIRAAEVFRQSLTWRKLTANAMRRDFSWRHSAAQYLELYRRLSAAPGAEPEPQVTRERALA
jgi:starch synthase